MIYITNIPELPPAPPSPLDILHPQPYCFSLSNSIFSLLRVLIHQKPSLRWMGGKNQMRRPLARTCGRWEGRWRFLSRTNSLFMASVPGSSEEVLFFCPTRYPSIFSSFLKHLTVFLILTNGIHWIIHVHWLYSTYICSIKLYGAVRPVNEYSIALSAHWCSL